MSNIPFNYSISITNRDNITDIIILDHIATHYLFKANQEDTCQKYNFTIKTINDAGSSEVSETLTVPIPNGELNYKCTNSIMLFLSCNCKLKCYQCEPSLYMIIAGMSIFTVHLLSHTIKCLEIRSSVIKS